MTTEIAILNDQGVALAADSAVTVGLPTGDQKIYTSANKIFGLSRRHPVALMIYNAGAFMRVPWETVVKLYREDLGDSPKSTVESYLAEFIGNLPTRPGFCSPEAQEAWFEALVRAQCEAGLAALRTEVEKVLQERGEGGSIDEQDLSRLAIERFGRQVDLLRSADPIEAAWSAEDLKTAHDKRLVEIVNEVFGGLQVSNEAKAVLVDAVAEFVTRRHQSGAFSGVVVAGFGHDELFPSLSERVVDGVVDGHLRAWPRAAHSVESEGPAIVPFAQDDMVRSFVEGVSPSYQRAIDALLESVITKYPATLVGAAKGLSPKARSAIETAAGAVGPQESEAALKELADWRSDRFISELLEIVGTLPKEELATLAEALVNLTSLRRRMSRQAETVGGPVDVAVISKGDGLIWIKRKHYFDPRLNPQYMANRYGGL